MLIESKKRELNIGIVAFQLCVIANGVFGSDAEYYIVSKVFMLLFFLAVGWRYFLRGGKIIVGRSLILPLVFTIYMALSYMWSYNTSLAYNQLKTELQLIILLFATYLIMKDGATIEDYLKAIYISGFGMILFSLYKYGGLNGYLDAMDTGMRMGGEIANENTFGLLFANASLAAVYYLMMKKQKRHIVSLVVFSFFALSSGSKKAVFMIIAGVCGICILRFGIKKIYKALIICAVFLCVAWYVLQLPIFATVNGRLMSYLSGESNVSDNARANMIRFGLQLFFNRPIQGYGLNNFRAFYYTGQYSHNNFVELLVSLGLIGFAIYYGMYAASIFSLIKKSTKDNPERFQYLMLLFLLIISIIFGYGMVQFYSKNVWILLGVALVVADDGKIYHGVAVRLGRSAGV